MAQNWIAVSYGALDMSDWGESPTGIEIMLLSIFPTDEPIGLAGSPAALWRRLVHETVNDEELTDNERDLVREYETVGLASRHAHHPARLTRLSRPWLSSPMHELVYALVGSLARDHFIDAVFIKGPMLRKQGLRERDHSGDVDVWVDPNKVARLAKLVQMWGMTEYKGLWTGIPTAHSITLQPGLWGCEVDLHRYLPGFALDNSLVFNRLWRASIEAEFAGVLVRIPQKSAHAVLHALHLTRPESEGRAPLYATKAASESLKIAGKLAYEFAVETRAVAALSDVASKAWPNLDCAVDYEAPLNWTWRDKTTTSGQLRAALVIVPWKYRPKYLYRIAWPTRIDVLQSDRRAGGDGKSVMRARARRLLRGFTAK